MEAQKGNCLENKMINDITMLWFTLLVIVEVMTQQFCELMLKPSTNNLDHAMRSDVLDDKLCV